MLIYCERQIYLLRVHFFDVAQFRGFSFSIFPIIIMITLCWEVMFLLCIQATNKVFSLRPCCELLSKKYRCRVVYIELKTWYLLHTFCIIFYVLFSFKCFYFQYKHRAISFLRREALDTYLETGNWMLKICGRTFAALTFKKVAKTKQKQNKTSTFLFF